MHADELQPIRTHPPHPSNPRSIPAQFARSPRRLYTPRVWERARCFAALSMTGRKAVLKNKSASIRLIRVIRGLFEPTYTRNLHFYGQPPLLFRHCPDRNGHADARTDAHPHLLGDDVVPLRLHGDLAGALRVGAQFALSLSLVRPLPRRQGRAPVEPVDAGLCRRAAAGLCRDHPHPLRRRHLLAELRPVEPDLHPGRHPLPARRHGHRPGLSAPQPVDRPRLLCRPGGRGYRLCADAGAAHLRPRAPGDGGDQRGGRPGGAALWLARTGAAAGGLWRRRAAGAAAADRPAHRPFPDQPGQGRG
jgi:hypothetical protein